MDNETHSMPLATGFDIIRSYLEGMPQGPGVYRMLGTKGDVLYVGKARNLKNRVTSYTNGSGLSTRILRMIAQTTSMEIITTKSEGEALLLEANLIKRLSPRYNILLKDDKSFPFILITADHDFPQILKHRGAQKHKGKYYGPFASAGAVNQSLAFLQRAFLLRPCSDNIFKNRTRPCLQYQIKRCSAPCVGYISKEDYRGLIGQARDFLEGKSRQVQEALSTQMQEAAAQKQYEKAASLRDRIRALTQVQNEHDLNAAGVDYADILGLHREGEWTAVQVFFFRSGQNYGNKAYFPSNTDGASDADILSTFIGQFYQTHVPPKEIIVSHPVAEAGLLEDALGNLTGYKISITHPQRGDKRKLAEHVASNAKASLARRMLEKNADSTLRKQLGELLGMATPPERIEVYDNSHIMGSNAVGAMIVAGPEGFIKQAYRQFNIKDITTQPGDDYAMLREVLMRRLSKLQQDENEQTQHWPDLLLIDGGAGQLSVTSAVMEELGITNITYACVSKGPDRNAGREFIHLPGKAPFQLPPDNALLHYIQRLRDEAHRFAIGTHRNKRSRAVTRSELDEIPGIGSTRKRALLLHFGSARAVRDAREEDLEKVPGINKKTAEIIYNYFHS